MTFFRLFTGRPLVYLIMAFAAFFGGISASSAGEKVIVVFDGSGSMWGQIDGTPKISIAREVLARSVEDWKNLDLEVGMIAYGHRRKGDCGDIETVIQPGPVDSQQFSRVVAGINPKGKTPLTAAVRQAAEELKYTEEKATVILLSDGLETCNLDPCAIASELEQNGVDFTTHVIGFDVAKEEEKRQLSCIAENTGGLFLAAGNAEELTGAFKQVIAPTPLAFVAVSALNGQEVAGPVTWSISGGDIQINTTTATARLNFPDAANGTYQVSAQAGAYKGGESIEIGDQRAPVIPVRLAAQLPDATVAGKDTIPASEEFEVSWTGPATPGDKIQLSRPGSVPGSSFIVSEDVSKGSPLTMVAPNKPGLYELRYYSAEFDKLLAQATIEVGEQLPTAQLRALDEVPAGGTFDVEWSGPGHEKDWVDLATPGTPAGQYLSYSYVKNGNPVQMRAPSEVGTYELRYINGTDTKIMGKRTLNVVPADVSVKALEEVPAGGTFEIAWTGPAHGKDWVDIATPGTPAGQYLSYSYVKNGNPLQMRAPSELGTYEIRYINGSDTKVMASRVLKVVAADVSVKSLQEVPAGSTFEIAWTGPGHEKDWVDIAAPGTPAGQYHSYSYVKNGNPIQMRAPSDPGTYEIRYINGSGTKVMATQPLNVVAADVSVNALEEVPAGGTFEIAWTGPGHEKDWVDIAAPGTPAGQYHSYSYVRNGNPVQMRAPSDPGTYEIRYINGSDTKIMSQRMLTVSPADVSVKSLEEVPAGSTFEIAWTGPGHEKDWIEFAEPNAPAGQYITYIYLRNGNPVEMRAPTTLGTYEIRYINGSETKIMGKQVLKVIPPSE
ncbi:MAG: VWA domain-containing protein [Stappiaceae bacterium]